MNNHVTKYNSWITALFLMQFSVLLPLSLIINIEYVYIIFTLSLLIISLIVNRMSFNTLFILFLVSITLVIILSMLLHEIPYDVIIYILSGFLVKSIVAIYVGSNRFDFKYLFEILTLLAWINIFIIAFSIIILNLNEHINYMRLGYGIVPSSVILLANLYIYKFKISTLLGFLLTLPLLLLYGSRGTFVVIILFLVLVIVYFMIKSVKGIISLAISGVLLGIILYFNMFSKLILYLYNDLGIYSYNLMKFSRSIEEGFETASSGRDVLYQSALNSFFEQPIFGNGVGYSFTYTNTSTHNFLLQILIESGLIGFLIIFITLAILYYKLFFINNKYIKVIFLIFTSISVGRLLISSDLWLRTELWLLVGITLMFINYKKEILKE